MQLAALTKCVCCAPVQAVIDVGKPAAASEYLLSAVLQPDLQQLLQQDLSQAVQLVSSTLQLDHVHAKLQIIQQQSCPNWHADTVGMRLLCTYAGPGTWYIANRCVQYTDQHTYFTTSIASSSTSTHLAPPSAPAAAPSADQQLLN